MAAPNLVNVSSVIGKTTGNVVNANADENIVTCAADKLLKINSVICANVDGTNDATVNLLFVRSDSTQFYVAYQADVVAKDTVVLVSKDAPLYLEEGDQLRIRGSANNRLQAVTSYEELDDA